MILFHRPSVPEDEKQRWIVKVNSYVITQTDTEVIIDVNIVYRHTMPINTRITIPITEIGTGYNIYYNLDNNKVILQDYYTVNPWSINLGSSSQSRSILALGRIFFEDTILLYLAGRYDDVSNVENVYITNDKYMQTMIEYSKSLRDRYYLKLYKSKFFNSLDVMDSISYLEAQVDSLNKVVIFLAKQAGLSNSELYSILTKADEYSVFTIKDAESVKKEMQHKKKVREMQQTYYDNRAKIE